MIIPFAAVCGGLALLTYGADRFVDGAAAAAHHLGIPPLLVGLLIVGFATSAPEMLVSAMAAVGGNPSLGIGNAIGSNITNIGLVLGITALVAPLSVRSTVLRREFPVLFVALLLATALLADFELSRSDGAILITALLVTVGITVWLAAHTAADDPLRAEFTQELDTRLSLSWALVWLLIGLALLLAGARLLVGGAVEIAQLLGVSDVVIGLTIVAIGTSLPELAASVMSAYKNEPEIALGNIIGSNIFNALGVLGLPGLLAPSTFDAIIMHRDIPYMLVLSVALLLLSWSYKRPGTISRLDGCILLCGFIAYQVVLFFSS